MFVIKVLGLNLYRIGDNSYLLIEAYRDFCCFA